VVALQKKNIWSIFKVVRRRPVINSITVGKLKVMNNADLHVLRSLVRRTALQTRKVRTILTVCLAVCLLYVFVLLIQCLNPNPAYEPPASYADLFSKRNFNLTGYTISQPLHVCGSLPGRAFQIDVNAVISTKVNGVPSNRLFVSKVHHRSFSVRTGLDSDTSLLNSSAGSRTLAFVISSPENHKRRDAIRHTWSDFADKQDGVRTLFVLGKPTDSDQWNRLQVEQRLNRDLLIFPFVDSYYTLLLKSVALMRWTIANCPDTLYVIKVDDDVLINWRLLNQTLDEWKSKAEVSPVVIGQKRDAEPPNRNSNSRWFVDTHLFAKNVFPTFVAGPMYVLSAPIVHELISIINKVTPIHLEDVFVTGLLRQMVPNTILVEPRPHLSDLLVFACSYRKFHALHRCTSYDMIAQWKYFEPKYPDDCSLWRELIVNRFQPMLS
jgi:hypothetical protein